MPLRIGFDLDGVLADFAGAYQAIDERLSGPVAVPSRAGDPEDETEADGQTQPETGRPDLTDGDAGAAAPDADRRGDERVRPVRDDRQQDPARDRSGRRAGSRRRRDAVWHAIRSTPDFWTTLNPIGEGAVGRIYELMLRHRWEVFFITQRPDTDGDTVQRQSQRWLAAQGFDLPTVLVVPGSRGAAAAALSLDYHVDDSPKNCLDVKSQSKARPLLIADPGDEAVASSARRLGVGLVADIGAALDVLDQASQGRLEPSLLEKVAKLVGWV
ncbi:MAG: hypothetical protein ACRD1V_00420 [Vicinamibacterales bacterium]